MKRHRLALVMLLAACATLSSIALPSVALGAGRDSAYPRIGLVLSGGGARGSAHIGVLKVLEEMRIPVHVVVGTSMGSLVGGGFAAGLPAAELERRVTQANWDVLFNDNPPRKDWPVRRKEASANPTWDFSLGVRDGRVRLPNGAISGQQVQLFFNDLVKGVETVQRFDALPIPFRAVATNLENGQMHVFDSGPLPVAMRASMSVPGLFAPMEWQDQIYVDGGLVRNLPIDVAREMGVDVIIAVNLGSGYLPRDQLGTILGVTGQMIAILTEQNVQTSLKQIRPGRDILIVPDLGDITSGDFDRAPESIATGEKAARKVEAQLARFSLSEEAYARWKRERFGPGRPVKNVGEVRVAGLQLVNPKLFDGLVDAQADQPLDRERLVDDIEGLYGRGDFERISYRFEPQRDGDDLLIVDAIEKAWGPGYLGFGLGFSSDNKGDNRFGLRATYNQTWMNRLGGEWSSMLTFGNSPSLYTEFYQPLDLDRALFVAPYLDLSSTPDSVFLGDQRVARYNVSRVRLGMDVGTTLNGVEVRTGAYYGHTGADLDTGSPELNEDGLRDSGLRGRIVYDTLDSLGAPRSGLRLSLEAMSPLSAMGAEVDYTRAEVAAIAAHSFGLNTITGVMRGGTSFGAEMPYYDQFPLGGFLKLSGYANEQFRGNDMAFAGLAYYRQIAALPPPIGRGLYLGASLEAGWLSDGTVTNPRDGLDTILSSEETRYGGSVFFGSDTWIGPAYLGIGLSATGESAFYVLIGVP
ncbi:BamA/TamA family outer membrane protein [Thiorhodococcus mannitoliphagus]|uniref:BamA/TamA family outer membrane protein n=1 Tax=Thiorhodococcus mannitoliphagus TaxID=329406 RepID=A0A6P1E2K4_9GAMM|nr:patatin-like phospholipase family protein [Thiorhodococcus mannitoliphagus]NEX23306.1 BamA/TamA family outer membrane protein [Thiorhodococcus mannitoliphagus]